MKKKKMLVGLMAMTIFVGVGIISGKLNKQKEGFFEKEVSKEKDNCVTVTHQSENDKEDADVGMEETVEDNLSVDQTEQNEETNEGQVTEDEAFEDCVTVTHSDESGMELTEAEISEIEVYVVGMKEEVVSQIADKDAFLYAIKECFYKTGVMESQVTSLNKVSRDYNDNLLCFSMYVNSQTLTYFDVVHDMNTGNYFVLMD